MSYTKSFAALAGAAALSAQMAIAAPQDAEIIQVQGFSSMGVETQASFIPPEVRPFIGDLNISVDADVKFEAGELVSDSLKVTVTGIECDNIEPIFEEEDRNDLARRQAWGMPRSAEEQAAADTVRSLFQNRVLDLDTEQVLELAGPNSIFVPQDLIDATTLDVHLECNDYVAQEPSFTPVEPN